MSLLEAQAAVAACRKLQAPLLEPPSEPPIAAVDPVTGVRKAGSSLPQLQQLIPQVLQRTWVLMLCIILFIMLTDRRTLHNQFRMHASLGYVKASGETLFMTPDVSMHRCVCTYVWM